MVAVKYFRFSFPKNLLCFVVVVGGGFLRSAMLLFKFVVCFSNYQNPVVPALDRLDVGSSLSLRR